jgi:hypothetical protein
LLQYGYDHALPNQRPVRRKPRLMGQVLTRCAETDRKVSTGLWMTPAQLQALTASHAFRCSACGKVHNWVASDAWVTSSPGRVMAQEPGAAS